ncbi:hypothetical protein [Pedococcus sp. 5OH_020]|uniref:hypothetical protein n=1 Tax=Pedococcus sp. 5OH_020 TaxID=2989814 RepID=UPI0022EA0FCB|nr:hypothetical protein [Pedococcus sp. 5OH_020]
MDGTARMRLQLERFGPVAGDVGGLLFFAFWVTRAHQVAVPAVLEVVVYVLALASLIPALVGYQLAQGAASSAWVGWAGIAAMGYGFAGQWALLCSGLALFGVSVVRCGVHARLPGLLLVAGGSLLLVVQAFAPVFSRSFAYLNPGWRGLTAVALVLVAAALTDLDVTSRETVRPQRVQP